MVKLNHTFSGSLFAHSKIFSSTQSMQPTSYFIAASLTVANLSNKLTAVDWYYLGIRFNIQPDQLRSIQASNPTAGVQRWMCDMLDLWLRSNPSATWADVVKALRLMGEHIVAERIQQNYLTSGITGNLILGGILYDWKISPGVISLRGSRGDRHHHIHLAIPPTQTCW